MKMKFTTGVAKNKNLNELNVYCIEVNFSFIYPRARPNLHRAFPEDTKPKICNFK